MKHYCHACNLQITDAYTRVDGKNYHPACFSEAAGNAEAELRKVFKTSCQYCGSTELIPTGTCHICRVCGESAGGC